MTIDKRIDNSKQNVLQDAFDKLTWTDMRRSSEVLTDKVNRGQDFLDLFPELAQDVFSSLYKFEPTLTETAPEGTELNRKQMESIMESEQYQSLRTYTALDDFSSAMATADVLNTVIERFESDPELRDLADKQNEANRNPQGKGKGNDGCGNGNGTDLSDEIAKAASKIRQAVKAGLKKAEKSAEENEEAFAALGCGTDSPERKAMDFSDKKNLLEQYKKVKNMAKYIGKYRNLCTSARTERIKTTKVELCGVTMGNDMIHALPQELASLNHDVLKWDFFRKMTEKQLLQYDMQADEPVGMGSIICLVDDSGSMYDENEYIARGIMFGLMECAKKDGRDFAVDIFSGSGSNFKMEIPKGKYTATQMMELLKVSYAGGTEYRQPLNWAMNIVKKDKFKNADIVLITDDEYYPNEQFISEVTKFKKEHDCKIIMVHVGGYFDKSRFEQWVDTVYADMGDETVTEIYKAV